MSITTIRGDVSSYGVIRYFESDRCFNNESMQNFNKGRIMAEELVTFDCCLLEMREITKDEMKEPDEELQILAVIVRPEIEPDYYTEREKYFEFCGYDLVELQTYISAITNCGACFEKAITYEKLNKYGLILSYREAVLTQLNLNEEYPDESHAYCEIIEIWRHINEYQLNYRI